jgi:hypothetical protein
MTTINVSENAIMQKEDDSYTKFIAKYLSCDKFDYDEMAKQILVQNQANFDNFVFDAIKCEKLRVYMLKNSAEKLLKNCDHISNIFDLVEENIYHEIQVFQILYDSSEQKSNQYDIVKTLLLHLHKIGQCAFGFDKVFWSKHDSCFFQLYKIGLKEYKSNSKLYVFTMCLPEKLYPKKSEIYGSMQSYMSNIFSELCTVKEYITPVNERNTLEMSLKYIQRCIDNEIDQKYIENQIDYGCKVTIPSRIWKHLSEECVAQLKDFGYNIEEDYYHTILSFKIQCE